MPKRVIDFDAMWGSDKLASCAAWAQAEYAWLYGLADACGCFELTNLRVIWGRVAAIRGDLTIERLEKVFTEFQDKGLLFVWEQDGKRYAHWTGSDVPGRLPAPSWRMRLERFAPPVPKQKLAEYVARFARGRAATPGGGFRAAAAWENGNRTPEFQFENSELSSRRVASAGVGAPREGDGAMTPAAAAAAVASAVASIASAHSIDRAMARGGRETSGEVRLKGWVEEAQAQNLNWNGNLKRNLDGNLEAGREAEPQDRGESRDFSNSNSISKATANSNALVSNNSKPISNAGSRAGSVFPVGGSDPNAAREGYFDSEAQMRPGTDSYAEGRRNAGARAPADDAGRSAASVAWRDYYRERELAVQKELNVGRGPVCSPRPVRAEVLERIRKRDEALAAERLAKRSK